MKTITAINVNGRRGYRRTNGNIYHSVSWDLVYSDGFIDSGRVPFASGYGDQYIETAFDDMIDRGLLGPRECYANGGGESLWSLARSIGASLLSSVSDVARKKDL